MMTTSPLSLSYPAIDGKEIEFTKLVAVFVFCFSLSVWCGTSSSHTGVDFVQWKIPSLCITNPGFLGMQYAAADERPRQFLSMTEEEMEMITSQVIDENLKHTLQFGIGLHHAGLNDRDRSLVEELFTNTKIQVLVGSHHFVKFSNVMWCFTTRVRKKMSDAFYHIRFHHLESVYVTDIGLHKHIGMGSESSSASCCHQGTCCLYLIMVMVLVL